MKKSELVRKILHIIIGVIVVALIYYNILNPMIIFWLLVFGIVCSLLCKRFNVPVLSWVLKKCDRKENIDSFPGKGAIFFAAGVLLALQLFRRDIALASIMILSL